MTQMQGPVLLHVWMIDPARADRHVELLTELFDAVADQPGFVSARILEAPDRSSLAALVEMETVEDRRRLEQLPQVHDVLQRLSTAASLVVRLYHDVAAVAAGASR